MQLLSPVFQNVVPYVSDALNDFQPTDTFGTTTGFSVDTDWLVPFVVRQQITIDNVWWHRANTTAGNVYVAIYDQNGNLLTDCAIDANTTAGYHLVPTTAVTLYPGQVYYGMINPSALVASRDSIAISSSYLQDFAPRTDMLATPNTDPSTRCYSKARANAAPLVALTMSGWTATNLLMVGGFVKQ